MLPPRVQHRLLARGRLPQGLLHRTGTDSANTSYRCRSETDLADFYHFRFRVDTRNGSDYCEWERQKCRPSSIRFKWTCFWNRTDEGRGMHCRQKSVCQGNWCSSQINFSWLVASAEMRRLKAIFVIHQCWKNQSWMNCIHYNGKKSILMFNADNFIEIIMKYKHKLNYMVYCRTQISN